MIVGKAAGQAPRGQLCSSCDCGTMSWSLPHLQTHPQCSRCRLILAGLQMDPSTWRKIRSVSQGYDVRVTATSPDQTGEVWLEITLWRAGSGVSTKSYSSQAIRECTLGVGTGHLATTHYPRQLARWTSHCRETHVHHPEIDLTELPPNFRLIDVQNNNIINFYRELPDSTNPNNSISYWALSYMWGEGVTEGKFTLNSDNKRDLEKKGSIDDLIKANKLSKTISDAIRITREAGQRYLWIDALCIPQDDHEKHAQLCAMDTIYSRADLVLIAASGSHANTGLLPGLSPGEGPNAHHIEDIGGRLHAACPSLLAGSAAISESPWHLRGWTLQEYALSRRAAFFTNRNILLSCGDELFDLNFDLTSSVHLQPADELRRPSRTTVSGVGGGPVSSTVLYKVIRQYLNRVLSFENDILNAVEGVFSHCLGGPGRHYWGIPEEGFGNWLTWYCYACPGECSNRPRDQSFPAWSWVAWKHCGVACCVVDSQCRPDLLVYRAKEDGSLVKLHGEISADAKGGGDLEEMMTGRLDSLKTMSSALCPVVRASTCFLWTKMASLRHEFPETRIERLEDHEKEPQVPVWEAHYVNVPQEPGDGVGSAGKNKVYYSCPLITEWDRDRSPSRWGRRQHTHDMSHLPDSSSRSPPDPSNCWMQVRWSESRKVWERCSPRRMDFFDPDDDDHFMWMVDTEPRWIPLG
ncbi:heterokaryon incompatibility protein-domain-containing protein [Cladorrhinum samala]|uniref:Heterokaryon incompatibility protein-domain-containing protein n=1 Tax=Cladorrhinum samala TaxID=585594 RepID=A0AAV9HXP8_9PEZI|nr:heterokaryon incompatibility protein-domain-containing protein [Cladorrhinum samala]